MVPVNTTTNWTVTAQALLWVHIEELIYVTKREHISSIVNMCGPEFKSWWQQSPPHSRRECLVKWRAGENVCKTLKGQIAARRRAVNEGCINRNSKWRECCAGWRQFYWRGLKKQRWGKKVLGGSNRFNFSCGRGKELFQFRRIYHQSKAGTMEAAKVNHCSFRYVFHCHGCFTGPPLNKRLICVCLGWKQGFELVIYGSFHLMFGFISASSRRLLIKMCTTWKERTIDVRVKHPRCMQ